MSSTTITFYGQSCFLLEYNKSKLLIDPSKKSHSQVEGDIVYATHHHPDHTAGIGTFLEINSPSAVLIGNIQVIKKYSKFRDQTITIKNVENVGIVVKTPSFVFGHLGDSVNFEGFANLDLDMLAVPIGSIFAASPKGAIKELKKFKKPLPIIVPMHWLWRSPKGFCKKLTKEFPETNCIVPKTGVVNYPLFHGKKLTSIDK
ncbi:MAG: MBL fold metallo-hydrolase [Candidatus Hodarchaeales archaeon]|jgi:L-ascorbate metabolism protein UlaG (beta-lactamase superfamily)